MRWRTLLLIAASLAASLDPVSLSAARTPAPVPHLGRVSTFAASSTRSIVFEIPKPVPLKGFDMWDEGDGRVHGWVLHQLNGPPNRRVMVDGATIGRCAARGCKAKPQGISFVGYWGVNKKMPAGIYRLTVIADGAPVTVHVVASTLRGRMQAFPQTPVASEILTSSVRMDAAGAKNVYSAGDYSELGNQRPDYSVFGMWAMGRTDGLVAAQPCAYYTGRVEDDPPEEAAFTPGCPLEEDGNTPDAFQAKGFMLTSSMMGRNQAPYGQGGWFATTTEVKEAAAVALWLDFAKR